MNNFQNKIKLRHSETSDLVNWYYVQQYTKYTRREWQSSFSKHKTNYGYNYQVTICHIYHLYHCIFKHIYIWKELQVSFYKNISISIIVSRIKNQHHCEWKKMILCMYRWWKREKRITYLSKILSPEWNPIKSVSTSSQLMKLNGKYQFMAGKSLLIGFPLWWVTIPAHAAVWKW